MNKLMQVILCGGLVVSITSSGAFAASKKRVTPAQPQAESAQTAEPMLLELKSELTPAPQLTLRTSGSPAFSAYSPQPDVYVVDLAQTSKANGLAIPSELPAGVASVSVDQAIELGKPLTRVTVRFSGTATPSTMSEGNVLRIALGTPAVAPVASSEPAIIAPAPVAEVLPQPVETVVIDQPKREPVVTATAKPKKSSSGKGKVLRDVETGGNASQLLVSLVGDGEFEYSTFRLSNPLRLVIDLKGVRNAVAKGSRELNDPVVRRVRVSQFKSAPEAVTRVVLDLAEMVDYKVNAAEAGVVIAFNDNTGVDTTTALASASTPVQPASVPSVEKRTVAPSADVVEQVPTIASNRVEPDIFAERHVINSASPDPAPQVTTTTRTTTPTTTARTAPPENVFTDTAQTGSTLTGGTTTGRTLTAGEKVYTGEPIDLNLKDADIKDVLRTFAQLTGLNIAIDPQVEGRVTVSFDDVPWDQALEIILKQNGLTYTLQGNVMRVGTIDRLAAEQAQIRKLEEDEQLNVQLQTVIKHLSYAKAGTVKELLQRMASRRGQIDFDARTNQIIITEIPAYLTTMLNLIETVDIPTPQVVIEARVVETTKQFSRDLGINWGFNGALDPALGTGTGLVFPNRVTAVGGPFNFSAGDPVLRLTLGNVLGTFDLDLTLTAAENEGLVRIVSAPKVTTQDNQPAEIQSGVQIPIQTRVQQTTTVSYVDATLRLSVTPQITSQDTVIMDITVQKTEPLPGVNLQGGNNAPLATRRATTKLMVRDGGTTVIGGIYQSSENSGQARLPFLSEIPVVGNLFKNRTFSTRHDELLIFITPRIVRNS